MGKISCPCCGEKVESDLLQCPNCKFRLELDANRKSEQKRHDLALLANNKCPKCEKDIPSNASICKWCGYDIDKNLKSKKTPEGAIEEYEEYLNTGFKISSNLISIIFPILGIIFIISGICLLANDYIAGWASIIPGIIILMIGFIVFIYKLGSKETKN